MSAVRCANCDADDLGCTACGALGTLVSSPRTERDAAVCRVIAGYVCNVSNLPEPLQVPALGRDLSPLIDGLAAALAPLLDERVRAAKERGEDRGWQIAHDEVCLRGQFCSAHQPIAGRRRAASYADQPGRDDAGGGGA